MRQRFASSASFASFASCVPIIAFATVMSACDGEEADDTAAATTEPIASCAYDFTLSIREGTHAGTDLDGDFFLSLDHDGSLGGGFLTRIDGDDVVYAVDGRMDGDVITLDFVGVAGVSDRVHGTGTLAKPFAECPEMVGDASGPAGDDRGDWQSRYFPEGPLTDTSTAKAICDSCNANSGCTFTPRPGTDEGCNDVCALPCRSFLVRPGTE